MKKKIISISLLLVILLSAIRTTSVAASVVSGDYTWTAVGDEIRITKYTGNEENVVIPATIDGNKITTLQNDLFKNNSKITIVTVPEGIEIIDFYAFYNCPNLTTINLPSTIKCIRQSAFYKCPKLKLNIPEHLEETDDGMYIKVANVTIKKGEYDYDKALKMVELANKHRSEKGVADLAVDNDLMEYAMRRAAELATYYSHYRPTGYTGSYGENIGAATYIHTAESAVQAWIDSAGHERNMVEERYKSTGTGFFYSKGGSYIVQVFSSKEAKNTTTKTGKISVDNKSIGIAEDKGFLNFIIDGISSDNTLSIGGTLSPKKVTLKNKGFSYASVEVLASDLKWTSSNKNIFTTNSNGEIKAIAPGTATLNVSLGDYSKDFTISVKDKYIRGDINDDGVIDVRDLSYGLIKLAKGGLTADEHERGDVTGDGKYMVQDLNKVLRFLAGKSKEL